MFCFRERGLHFHVESLYGFHGVFGGVGLDCFGAECRVCCFFAELVDVFAEFAAYEVDVAGGENRYCEEEEEEE